MRLLHQMPIRRKLIIITMLTSCLTLLLACVAVVIYEQVTFRAAMVNDLLSTAKMIGDNSSAALSFNDPASAEQTLKSLSADPHIVGGAVYNKEEKPFARYARAGLRGGFTPPPVGADGYRFAADHLELFQKIELAGETVGVVYIQSDLGEMRTRLWRYALILLVVVLTALVVAYLLSTRLQRVISEPISHLATVAGTVATDRDYSIRATKQSEDELGRLIDGFNEMLNQIQSRDSALQEAHDKLEERVQDRTKALQMEINERRQAEEALREGEARIRTIVDTALDAVVTMDAGGVIVDWNPQAESMFGWPRQEAVGSRLCDLIIPHKYREAHENGLAPFLASGDGPVLNKRIEITALHRDGRELDIELAVTPLRSGRQIAFSAFIRDITERKRAEAELFQAHRQLLEVSRQAGMAEVATGVLHNVGNVLNSVNVSVTLVTESLKKSKAPNLGKAVALMREHLADLGAFFTDNPKGKQLPGYLGQLAEHLMAEQGVVLNEVESLRKNIEHMKDIVAMQQSYAKVSGVAEIVNVTDLVEDSLRMNAAALARHDIKVVREYDDIPPILAEKHKVLQILVNLVRNAKYACDESGHRDKQVVVRVTRSQDRIRIALRDNGIGIPPENLTRIFAHGFTTKKTGHGFGLHSGALAAKEMGGSLQAQSDGPGHGATFILDLPLELNREPHPKAA
jgi:PAS domain S-box-containing protein